MLYHLNVLVSCLLFANCAAASTTLFNGLQQFIFPPNTSTTCLASFNESLACDPLVQGLYVQNSWMGWNATNLTVLCSSDCRSSLTRMRSTVVQSCPDLSLSLSGQPMTADKVMDFYIYKFNLTCLSDGSNWCLLEEKKWFIEYLSTVTWPSHTYKWYPDWDNDPINGTNRVDENGTVIQPWVTPLAGPPVASTTPSALDYVYHGGTPANGTLNATSAVGLEYDEYPLEIQCSSCFQQRFKLGFMSRFGEIWDEVKAQAWDNMKLNCKLEEDLYVYPTLNQSGPPNPNRPSIQWTGPAKICDRTVTTTQAMNISTFSLTYNVSTASVFDLNRGLRSNVPNGTYCLPLACEVAPIYVGGGTSALMIISPEGQYPNISLVNFMSWNGPSLKGPVLWGDTVCIGPPGGAFYPADPPPGAATPTTYTTTAVPAEETPPGTIANCGLYYDTVIGDYCYLISLKYGITFDLLREMNPQIDSNCSNLWANASYCVATVAGTNFTTATSSLPPSSSSTAHSTTMTIHSTTATTSPHVTSSSQQHTSMSTSSGTSVVTVAAPAPTQPGADSACQEWYVAKSGDYCYLVYTEYSITFDQLRAWNPYLDEACDNMWPDYAYCVKA